MQNYKKHSRFNYLRMNTNNIKKLKIVFKTIIIGSEEN